MGRVDGAEGRSVDKGVAMSGYSGRRASFAMGTGAVLLFVASASSGVAAEWSAEQRAALGVLESACEALKQGKMEKLIPLYHDQFVGWDLAQPAPSTRAVFLEEEAAFLRSVRSVDSQVTPITIEIAGETAALQVRYRNEVVMGDGQRLVSTGRWSTTLVKKRGGWVFLSSAFLADK